MPEIHWAPKTKAKPPQTAYDDIPEGTWFTGRIGTYNGLFVRVYGQMVYVPDPSKTWGDIGVQDYCPVAITVSY